MNKSKRDVESPLVTMKKKFNEYYHLFVFQSKYWCYWEKIALDVHCTQKNKDVLLSYDILCPAILFLVITMMLTIAAVATILMISFFNLTNCLHKSEKKMILFS